MKLFITTLFTLIISMFCICDGFAAEIIHTTANLSQARWRFASAVVGTKAIFAGGQGKMEGSYSNVVDIYDYTTGLWTTAALSQARCDLAAVTVGTKVLFAGGYNDGYQWSNVIDIYDSAADTWSTAAMPVAAHNYCAFSFGNKAFFASGTASNNRALIYDTQANTWQTVNLSAARYNIAAAKTSDMGFFAGGNNGGYNTYNVDVYDSNTNTWSVEYLSSRRTFVSATTIGSKALFAGGCTTGPVNTVDIYDTSTDTWSVANMPGPLGKPEATSVGDFAFFAGCWSSRNVYVYDISNMSWRTFTLSGGYRYSLTAVSVGNQALFAGGGDYSSYYSTVDIFTVVPEQAIVSVDIKPLSCPNPLNVKSKGVLPVAVLGSDVLDVNEIDVASLQILGVKPTRSSYEDVAAPVSQEALPEDCICNTDGPDGFMDIVLKFDTQEIVEAIGDVNDGDSVILTLAGSLKDGTPIEGTDCVVIIRK